MPDPLFASARPSSSKKRKLSQPSASRTKAGPSAKKPRRNIVEDDDDLQDTPVGVFDDVDLEPPAGQAGEEEAGSEEDETPAQKRLRLAKLYLDSVKKGVSARRAWKGQGGDNGSGGDEDDGDEADEPAGWDAADVDREIIEARLQRDVLENSGRTHIHIAESLQHNISNAPYLCLKSGHRLPLTASTLSEDGLMLFSSSKDGSIIKWDTFTGKRLVTFPKMRAPAAGSSGKGKGRADKVEGHTGEVLAIAVSSDGRWLASGGKDRRVVVWDAKEMKWIKSFTGHKDGVTSLVFRKNTHQLFTASFDRTIKLYDLSPSILGYVETLFGHQDHILSVDALRAEVAVSAGARDKTVRFWKVVEESQLVFRGGGRSKLREVLEGGIGLDDAINGEEEEDAAEGHGAVRKSTAPKVPAKKMDFAEGSMECVAMIDESTFLSGGDSGSIRLWFIQKKKAVFTQALAHGLHEVHSNTEGVVSTPRWISSLAAMRYSDVFVSGSWDGCVRLWRLDESNKSFSAIGTLPAPGFINSLQMISPPPGSLDPAAWVHRKPDSQAMVEVEGEEPMAISMPAPPKPGVVQDDRQHHCMIVAACAQEPRLGRWMRISGEGTGSRNQVLLWAVPYQEQLATRRK
ncbi:pre-rRNA processing protein [Tulasnella sp. JGI-2019a]|nr:pre-rRNA processing protein [Tulasnella sp. JGI-2019a]